MKAQWKRRILSYLCCLLLLTAPTACAATQASESTVPAETAHIAPNVIELFKTETKLDLTPYEGKAIFINFFTQWCFYCMQEMPDIKAIYDEYSEDDLQIILVHVWDGENASHSEEVRTTYGLEDLTIFEDEDTRLARFVGLQGYPASLFIAKDGTLHSAFNYMVTRDLLVTQMDELGVAQKEAVK